MEGIQVHAPRPPAHIRAAIERDRAHAEERARRHLEREIEQRARARAVTCPGCGIGGFDGYCVACDYTGPALRIEHRNATAPPNARPRRCGHCGGTPPNCCVTMWMAAT
jgi:hypothetical protein